MKQPLLWMALSLVAACRGVPYYEIDRPSTQEPPQVQGDVMSYLCEVLYSCEKSTSPMGATRPPGPAVGVGESCQCVHHTLCEDSTTDGVADAECESQSERCCQHVKPDRAKSPYSTKHVPTSSQSKCGNRNSAGLAFRVSAGNFNNKAQYGEFPWMVAVVRPDTDSDNTTVRVFQCGGSLIHPQVVLTTAHCVAGKDNLIVSAGEWDIQAEKKLYPTQDRNVAYMILHEQFEKSMLLNDLALLVLDRPVDITKENVGLICLPEASEDMDNRNCVVTGWGKDSFGEEGKYQRVLNRVDLPMVPRSKCLESLRSTRLGPHFNLHESFVCAGGVPGKDTCKGDGGGPLVCPSRNNSNVYVQAGIVAWGVGCSSGTPGVYVNVPHFIDWMNNKLQAQGINLS